MVNFMRLKSQDGTVSGIKQLAIIGATASGKTALALKVAKKHDGLIFSIDSLAIYKEMDIVSAKPSLKEQDGIIHFGIDQLEVPEHFSAAKVALIYKEALAYAKDHGKNLIIVGGSSFYLKSLMTGLSQLPEFSNQTIEKARQMVEDVQAVYELFSDVDPQSLKSIEKNDSYRLEKLLLIYLQTNEKPSSYFAQHPPLPIIEDIVIFELLSERQYLRERIALRTKKMLESGLIDEIASLEKKYGRNSASMKAIGVIETLQYLDSEIDLETLESLIATHTAQLAKRQTTFNKTQFEGTTQGDADSLSLKIDKFLKNR